MAKKNIRHIAALVFFIFAFCFFGVNKGGFFYTDSKSMEPTIKPGDRMILTKPGVLKRDDIVIFRDPQEPKEYLVKRLIGLPGDVVEVTWGRFYRNGKPVEEPYLKESFIVYIYGPAQVPTKSLFVLGDNRNNSEDSSVWGFLPNEELRGKVIFRYWPPDRFGRIK
jgi:signal peptidase I